MLLHHVNVYVVQDACCSLQPGADALVLSAFRHSRVNLVSSDDVVHAYIEDDSLSQHNQSQHRVNQLLEACRDLDVEAVRGILAQEPALAAEVALLGGRSALHIVCGALTYLKKSFHDVPDAATLDLKKELLMAVVAPLQSAMEDPAPMPTMLTAGMSIQTTLSPGQTARSGAMDGDDGLVVTRAASTQSDSIGLAEQSLMHAIDQTVVSDSLLCGGDTPLTLASRCGYTELVQLLLAYGANPNVRENCEGLTPLLLAARAGHAAVITQLVQAGARLDARSRQGVSALMYALSQGVTPSAASENDIARARAGLRCVKALLFGLPGRQVAALLEMQDNEGWNALHYVSNLELEFGNTPHR